MTGIRCGIRTAVVARAIAVRTPGPSLGLPRGLPLRLAAGGSVAGVGESALRALSILDQVMPARLRQRVDALQVTRVAKAGWQPSRVDTAVLLAIGQAVRAREARSSRTA